MGLKKLLDAGFSVVGTKLDKKLKSLADMTDATQQRLGYADKDGYRTDRGVLRETTIDIERLDKGTRARARTGK